MSIGPGNRPSPVRRHLLPARLRLLAAVAGAVLLSIAAVVTLGLVVRLVRRVRGARAGGRPGSMPGGANRPGVRDAATSPAAGRHGRSRAVVIDAWPLAL